MSMISWDEKSEELYCEIRDYRLMTSKKLGIQVYYVLTNQQMIDLTILRPRNEDEFLMIDGLTLNKYNMYGKDLLAIIRKYN